MTFRRSLFVPLYIGLIATPLFTSHSRADAPKKPADLFVMTKVWDVHLTVTPDNWTEMEPKGGAMGFFGGPPPGGPPRPGAPGQPPPRRPRFGPSMFIAPVFMTQSDKNKDGKISAAEFNQLAETWFTAWDKDKLGNLNLTQLRKGMNASLTMAPPGGGGGAPFSLQAPTGQRNGVAGMMGIEFKYVRADLEFNGQKFKDIGLRYKGNGTFLESRASLKRSLKLDFNRYVKGQKLAGLSMLNLHNNVTDASLTNEPLAFRAFREADVPAPRTSYARVYVTVPGKYDRKYFGVYSVIENVDGDFEEDRFGTRKGTLFKPSTQNLFAYQGDDWKKYNQSYDPKSEPSAEEKKRMISLFQLVTNGSDAEFAAKIGDYIDLDEFARFMAVTVWITDLDSLLDMGQNFYMHLDPKTQKLKFIAWDQDHSFGQFFPMGAQETREQLSLLKPWQGDKKFLERIFKLDAFKKRYLANVEKFHKTIFQPERFAKQIDEIAAAIRPAVQEESETKLTRFDKAIGGESLAPSFGFGPPGMPAMQIKPTKPFVRERAKSVADQLTRKSEGKTLTGFGFGTPPPPPGGGRPGGAPPPDFGPGTFMAPAFMRELDADKDSKITRQEFVGGFAKWFAAWNADKSGFLTDEQLREGMDETLSPFRGAPPPNPFGG